MLAYPGGGGDDFLIQSAQQAEAVEEYAGQPDNGQDFHAEQETVKPADLRRKRGKTSGACLQPINRKLGTPFIESRGWQIRREANGASRAAETLQPPLAGVVAPIQEQTA